MSLNLLCRKIVWDHLPNRAPSPSYLRETRVTAPHLASTIRELRDRLCRWFESRICGLWLSGRLVRGDLFCSLVFCLTWFSCRFDFLTSAAWFPLTPPRKNRCPYQWPI